MKTRPALPAVMLSKVQSICFVLIVLHLIALAGSSAPVCLNGGTLYADKNSFFRCLCTNGFIGATCKDPDPCVPSPCKNYGTCTRTGNSLSATCQCIPGYTGDDCGTEVFPCASNPCVTGKCLNNATRYHCVCPPGYTGQKCETHIGFCAAGNSPCSRHDPGATCTDTDLGYTCACSKDNFGFNCESKALSLPAGGCKDVGDPESYCLCSANGNTVKVPLELPRSRRSGVKSSDFAAGFVGLLLGWLLGTALLTLYYCCCYKGAAAGDSSTVNIGSRVGPHRPDTASSMQSDSTALSDYIHHNDSKSTAGQQQHQHQQPYLSAERQQQQHQQPYPSAERQQQQHQQLYPSAVKPAPAPVATMRSQPSSPLNSNHATSAVAAPANLRNPSRNTNIYRASFLDDMAHQVSVRKSPHTYGSASKDW